MLCVDYQYIYIYIYIYNALCDPDMKLMELRLKI